MKYERLTKRDKNGNCHLWDDTVMGMFNALDHLAELEDKIERGELVEVPKGAVVLTPEERAEEMRLANEERKQAVKEFADKIITSGTTVYDPCFCREFIKLPMERYENLIKEACGE